MSLEVTSVIDIDPSQPYISVVHCKQYDTVRVVEAHLYTDGVKWYVPSNNIYTMVQYRKSDHIGGFYDIVDDPSEPGGKRTAVSINSGDRSIIYISIAQEVLTTATPLDSEGTTVEVVFYDTISSARLGLFYFHLKVEEASIREVDLANNPYFNILAEQIKAVLEAETKLTGLTATGTKLAPGVDPTATVTGGSSADDPYVLNIGVPSMTSITGSGSKLAPGANPTVSVSGGQSAGQAYNIAIGVPSMPGMTVSKTALKPGATPTVTISGGTTAGENYNLDFGIPAFPGVTASATGLGPGVSPTATVTGGTSATSKYNIAFGIPKGDIGPTASPTATNYTYANSDTKDRPPDSSFSPTNIPTKGKYFWTKTTTTWSGGSTTVTYIVTYCGNDGSGSVQSVNGRVGDVIVTSSDIFQTSEINTIENIGGTLMTTVKTIVINE